MKKIILSALLIALTFSGCWCWWWPCGGPGPGGGGGGPGPEMHGGPR